MASWISMDDACRQLGVQAQTVYAYVSRGKLAVTPDPADSRRSLYRAEDVAALAKRKQAGRKHETLAANTMFGAEPSVPTALTAFFHGRPHYRGQDATVLAQSAPLEQAAQWLWDAEQPVDFSSVIPLPPQSPGRAAAFGALATLAASGHSTRGRLLHVLHQESQGLVAAVADAFGAQPGPGLLHERLARGWQQPAAVAELLRTAMVLLMDHELTSSAFAARIAASNGASLPACLLAGLSTLSGPLHGDASGRVRALFAEVDRLGEEQVVAHYLSTGQPFAGFGHFLYPDGDPRASALLALFEPPPVIARFIARVTALTGLQPNVDVAMAALVAHHRLPADAAFGLMATTRSVGLLAHSMEQLSVTQVIRPRGRYVGLMPAQAQAPAVSVPAPSMGSPFALPVSNPEPSPPRRRKAGPATGSRR